MNHPQKILAVFSAAALLLCAGCGSSTTEEKSSSGSSAVTTAANSKTTSAAAKTAKTTKTSSAAVTAATTASTEKTTSAAATTTKAKTVHYVDASAGSKKTTTAAGNSGSSQGNANSNNNSNNNSNSNSSNANANTSGNSGQNDPAPTVPATEPDVAETPAEIDETVYITLRDGGSSADNNPNNAVSISGNVITITQAGRYEVTGTLSDGQIVVSASKEDKVNLHFNGVGITCSNSAPLSITSADTCTLHLDSGSTNYLQDTANNAMTACISSKDDLTIKGEGSLTVTGSKKHAIKSSNDVKIKNGSLTISAVSTGVYGEDSVQITGGNVVITNCKDGLKASNIEEADKGYFYMENGYVDVQNAAGNGIEAITGITISGGTVNIHSAKKSTNCDFQTITDGCLTEY